MDLLCREKREASKELKFCEFSSLFVFGAPKRLSGGIVTAAELSLTVDGL